MPISATVSHAGKFLQEHELLPEARFCSWCNFGGNRARILPLQSSPDVWLLKCPACHAVSASRVAAEAALVSYYTSYYSDTALRRVTCGSPSRHARHICRNLKLPPNLSRIEVLDFGGGDGSISHAVAVELGKQSNAPIDIVVVDYNQVLVSPIHPRVTLSNASNFQDIPTDRRFHLVLASAIIEHLPDPAEITRKLLSALAPGGCFYARTPYVVPLLQICRRLNMPFDFTFPGHFHDLGQDFWENILGTLNMASGDWTLARSAPSVVETSFSEYFGRTLLAYGIKAPWWILRRSYPLVGGWEVFILRKSRS